LAVKASLDGLAITAKVFFFIKKPALADSFIFFAKILLRKHTEQAAILLAALPVCVMHLHFHA